MKIKRPQLEKTDPCPSCNDTGWAVIMINPNRPKSGAIASGPCRCVGGHTWRNPTKDKQ